MTPQHDLHVEVQRTQDDGGWAVVVGGRPAVVVRSETDATQIAEELAGFFDGVPVLRVARIGGAEDLSEHRTLPLYPRMVRRRNTEAPSAARRLIAANLDDPSSVLGAAQEHPPDGSGSSVPPPPPLPPPPVVAVVALPPPALVTPSVSSTAGQRGGQVSWVGEPAAHSSGARSAR